MTLKLFRGIFALLISINGFLADNSCRYELPGRGVINLASIGLRNNQPTFRDISPLTGANYVYSFNPCYSFTEASCGNVAACQISRDGAFAFTLAEQNSSVWTYDAAKNALALTYTLQAKTVDIQMFCSEGRSHQLEVVGEVAVNYYVMRLRSPCACWNGCDAPVTSSTTSKTSTTPTIYSNPCVYNHPRFGTIDLSSVGNLNGTAVFADVPTIYTDDYLWSYNPCVPFTERSCYRVAGCQKSKTLQTSFPIGLQERAQWINMNTTANLPPSIVYSTLGDERHLTVQLVCNSAASDHQLQAVGEISTNHYLMILTSRCACWNGCYSDPSPPGRHHFKWQAWMTIVSVAAGVLLCLCSMITCLICCKPKRQFHRIIIDEHTPIVRSAMDRYPTVKK